MNESSAPEPGRKVRIVCNWVVGALVAVTVWHVLFPPGRSKTDAGQQEESSEPADPDLGIVGRALPMRRVAVATNPVNGDRAMGYLRAICELGPRISGTPAMAAQQKLVVEHFGGLGAEIEVQRFQARHPKKKTVNVRLANVIARWRPLAPERVMLCGHYDTRPMADQDVSARARRTEGSCLGANDGGSSTAVLMELAHLMHERFDAEATDPDFGVDFVLFDAEELVYSDRDPYFLGSQWFGRQYKQREPRTTPDGESVRWRYDAAVLLDMVGAANLELHWEGYSFQSWQSRPICREVWDVAERLGVAAFKKEVRASVQDDHLALRKYGGIRAIDVIQFPWPYWHTTRDTPENCSGESLAKVGWVMWEWILERGRLDDSRS